MKFALAQLRVCAAHPEKNYLLMLKNIEQAIANRADVIFFPEMALPGYFNGDAWEQTDFLQECAHYGDKIIALSQHIDVVFGSVGVDWQRKNEDGLVRKYNALFHASQGALKQQTKIGLPFWPKTLLPNYQEFDDSRHFFDLKKLSLELGVALEDLYLPLTFSSPSGESCRVLAGICEDAWDDDYAHSPFELMAKRFSADFALNLSASPFRMDKIQKRIQIFQKLAQKIKVPIFYLNCIGTQNLGKTIFGFDGSSMLVYPEKKVFSFAPFFQESLDYFDYKKENATLEYTGNRTEKSNRAVTSSMPFALESLLKFVLQEWQIERVVVGVSGGIDSALSAALFSRVLGPENTFLINMPSRFNSQLTQNAARALAENLGCPYGVLGIDPFVSLTQKSLQGFSFTGGQSVSLSSFHLENVQSRIRGSMHLATLAAALGGVYSCNANKAELTVGYGTLYGDLGGFLAPLADLWKHQVYNLARAYNQEIFGRNVIPEATLHVVPSAELSTSQDVTKNLGDPLHYPYHDFLFRAWVEQRKTPVDCLKAYQQGTLEALLGCEVDMASRLFSSPQGFIADLEKWWGLYQGLGAFKRLQSPPILALNPRTFGFDHRENVGLPSFSQRYQQLKQTLVKE